MTAKVALLSLITVFVPAPVLTGFEDDAPWTTDWFEVKDEDFLSEWPG